LAQPAYDLSNLNDALLDALQRLEDAEERTRAAQRRADRAEDAAGAATIRAEAAELGARRAEHRAALAEGRARRAEEMSRRYRALIAHLPDTNVVVFDTDLRYQVVEGRGFLHDGAPPMEGRTPRDLFAEPVAQVLEQLYRQTLAGTHEDEEIDLDGQTLLVQGRPVLDDQGRITGGMVLSRDVTRVKQTEDALRREREALRETLAQREVLLREVYHRVKNNLQVVNSLLSLQSRTIVDPAAKQALTACRQRVSAMARVHEQLYRSPDVANIDLSTYLRELTGEVDRTYRVGTAVRVELELAPVELDLQRAIPIGLIAHELIANAFIHAFPGDRTGHITVGLREHEGDSFDLIIADDGVGLGPETSRTLGRRLVASLVAQLGATLTVDSEPGSGTCWTVHVPEATC